MARCIGHVRDSGANAITIYRVDGNSPSLFSKINNEFRFRLDGHKPGTEDNLRGDKSE
jgi:hypothetical protein